ncbi:MAG: aminoacetone oxidase family FAD-binding enzyme [Bacteroides sp.]|nr:aminoacetone oxidase family FAD-binding enzyme [Bacteroides sp.]
MEKNSDILIIGGGAAGLACAVSAARASKGLRITVIDRMPRVGKKISVTGNGRCNLSNLDISPKYYHGSVDISGLLADMRDIRPFFESLGLFTYADGAGRIYPLSNTASSVVSALRLAAEKEGVSILTDSDCIGISKRDGSFRIKTDKEEIRAKAAVLACGGAAAQVHGSNGSGFVLAGELGLRINTPYPALCSLTAEGAKSMDGVRAKCKAELIRGGRTVRFESGEVQFTKSGLSGICIFNLSAEFASGDYSVRLDLAPDLSDEELTQMLSKAVKARSGAEAGDCFNGIFNKAVAFNLLKKSGISVSTPAENIGGKGIERIAKTAKGLEFKIKGRGDLSSAQVTAGGVSGEEINDRFMSKKIKGLFLAGEILDIWGDCGGYNLHFAFASGVKAGREAAAFIKTARKDK